MKLVYILFVIPFFLVSCCLFCEEGCSIEPSIVQLTLLDRQGDPLFSHTDTTHLFEDFEISHSNSVPVSFDRSANVILVNYGQGVTLLPGDMVTLFLNFGMNQDTLQFSIGQQPQCKSPEIYGAVFNQDSLEVMSDIMLTLNVD